MQNWNRIACASLIGMMLCVFASRSVFAQPTAVLQTGTATVCGSGTVFTSDPSNTGFDPAATAYESITVAGGAALTVQGYPVLTQADINTALNDGLENIGGGVAHLAVLYGSVATVEGGSVGETLGTTINGTLNVSAGLFGSININAGGILNMMGGVDVFNGGLKVSGGGTANISGGTVILHTVVDTSSSGTSVVNISGGSVVSPSPSQPSVIGLGGVVNLAGAADNSSLAFTLSGNGTLDLFGTFPGYADGDIIGPGESGEVTGVLAAPGSGQVGISYDTTSGGMVEFNVGTFPVALDAVAVPEPGTLWLFSGSLIGFAALARRKRVRAVLP